jgi:hypothetical protein
MHKTQVINAILFCSFAVNFSVFPPFHTNTEMRQKNVFINFRKNTSEPRPDVPILSFSNHPVIPQALKMDQVNSFLDNENEMLRFLEDCRCSTLH